MSNVESNQIRIFPSSNRTAGNNGTNFLTEYNLSSIVNKLLMPYNGANSNGFLITTDINDNYIEFNIGGYFVNVAKSAIVNAINNSSGEENIYQNFVSFNVSDNIVNAIIRTNSSAQSNDPSYIYMLGSDNVASDATISEGNTISLPILNVNGAEGSYQITSLYSNSKLRLVNFAIDDGTL